ncbi:unnamed protein product, partial [Closterium sp. NIES-53]
DSERAMAITCENSSGDDDDDALYPATEMLEARTGLDFLVSALSHEKEKQAPLTSGSYTGEASDLSRGDDRFQPAHTAKPAVASADGPSVRLPSRASSSKPPPRYKQAVLCWADPTAPARPLADDGESAFKRHAATNKHQLAIEHQKKMLAQAGKQPRIDAHPLAKDDETTRVIALLNSLHFTTQNHLPMETWVRLVRYGFGELTQATAVWLQTTQLEHILRSHYIGLSCDESTDRCRGKNLIIYVTYIRDGAVVTEFFALLTVDRADAASLVGLLLSHVNAVGIDLRRITGISTDWASVMVGSKNGLVARLRTRIPHLVSCHCIAHREALAAKDAAESLPEFGMVDSFIRWLSTYLGSSGP